MLLVLFTIIFLFGSSTFINGFCPNDDDLQRHRCSCSLSDGYVRCSSLPEQCRTCYQYQTILFDDNVDNLPNEAFRFYEFFRSDIRNSFVIQFTHLTSLSTNAFSKIDIDQNQTLNVKISKLSSTTIPTRLFEDLTIQSNGIFDFEIYNVTSLFFTIEQYAFDGLKLSYQSRFRFVILSAKDTIEFQSNAGTLLTPSYSTMEFYFSNFNRVLLNEHCFDHITQEHSSQLRIDFDHFQQALIEHRSFVDLHQLDQSQFHIMFANFQQFNIEKTVFDTITQLKSSVIFSIFNLTEDLCLPAETFSQIRQDMNSSFQFQVHFANKILFSSNSVINISQRAQSKFSILMIRTNDIYFDQYAIDHFHQEDRSLLDIWIKYGHHLIFEDNSIQNIDIWRSSLMRIGFQNSQGKLQMKTNAFHHINEGQGGELLFQIQNSTDFYFHFNQSIHLQRLEILDRILINDDFCRIINIPSHIPMKLLPNQPCSCPVYYLYRHLHHRLNPTLLKDLTPNCYSNLSLDQIEHEEFLCSFDTELDRCKKLENQFDLTIPNGLCHHQHFKKTIYQHSSHTSTIILVSMFVLFLAIIYILSTHQRRMIIFNRLKRYSFHSQRQKLPIFSTDSYQQLTQFAETNANEDIETKEIAPKTMKIVVKYNSTTEQTKPCLHQQSSDFLMTNDQDENIDEDQILRLNTNPLSDMEINQ